MMCPSCYGTTAHNPTCELYDADQKRRAHHKKQIEERSKVCTQPHDDSTICLPCGFNTPDEKL